MKIESVEKNNVFTVILASDNNEFIGKCYLKRIDDNILEVSSTIARKTYGKSLYQAAAMIAKSENSFIVSDRTGDTRESAMANWDKFENNEYKSNKILLDEHFSDLIDFTCIEDDPVYFHGYNMEESKTFKKSYSKVKEFSFPEESIKVWDEFYITGYELEDTSFIDEDYPLTIKESNSLEEKEKPKRKSRIRP